MPRDNILFTIFCSVFFALMFIEIHGTAFPLQLNDVLFDSGSFTLDDQATENLDNNIGILKSDSDTKIVLEGYCDEKGDPDLNRELSAKRVRAVKRYLVSHGIDIDRISTEEKGSTNKFSGTGLKDSSGLNRRVHFKLINPENKSLVETDGNEENTLHENGGDRNVVGEMAKTGNDRDNKVYAGIDNIVDIDLRKSLAAPVDFNVPRSILNQQYFTVNAKAPDDYNEILRSEVAWKLRNYGLSQISGTGVEIVKFELKGRNFEIETSPAGKKISNDIKKYRSLSWRVKPTEEGIQSLILSVKLRTTGENESDLLEIPLYERVVKVKPGYISSVTLLVSNYKVLLIILSIILILFIMYRNIPGMFPK